MQLTIIKDGSVGVNGVWALGLALPALPLYVHALQWNGSEGEIEYADTEWGKHQNMPISALPEWALKCVEVYNARPKE